MYVCMYVNAYAYIFMNMCVCICGVNGTEYDGRIVRASSLGLTELPKVCMYVYMYVCMYACMHVNTCACICLNMFVCMYMPSEWN